MYIYILVLRFNYNFPHQNFFRILHNIKFNCILFNAIHNVDYSSVIV